MRPYWDYRLTEHVQDAAGLAAALTEAVALWRRHLPPWLEPWIAPHEMVARLLGGLETDDLPALRRIQAVCAARAAWSPPEIWVCEHDAWRSLMHLVRRVADRVDRRLASRLAP